MKRYAGWLAGAALLAMLGAGCGRLNCQAESPGAAPAASESEMRDAAAAAAVMAKAAALYQGEDRPFLSIDDYDTVIATLRAGVQDYPRTAVAPKMQLLLADLELEKRKQLNHRDLMIFERVDPNAAAARMRGGQDLATSTFGEGLQHVKPFHEALAAYEKVFSQWPQSEEAPQALYRLANLYAAPFNPQRDPARALFYYQKLVNEYPQGTNADWALFSMANTYRDLGDVQQAMARYGQLHDSYPLFSPVLDMMGQKYIADHDTRPRP